MITTHTYKYNVKDRQQDACPLWGCHSKMETVIPFLGANNLRHCSLEKNLKNTHRQFQISNSYSYWYIDVQKIEMRKMILNSYFLKKKAYHIFKDMVRWTKKTLFLSYKPVNVLAIARQESKILQTTPCLLMSILQSKDLKLYQS